MPSAAAGQELAQIISRHAGEVDCEREQERGRATSQTRDHCRQRPSAIARVGHDGIAGVDPIGMRGPGNEHFVRLELSQNPQLPLPERNAVDLDKRFVAAHATRRSAGEQDRTERHAHIAADANSAAPVLIHPSVKICARNPPFPCKNASVPGANAWSSQ